MNCLITGEDPRIEREPSPRGGAGWLAFLNPIRWPGLLLLGLIAFYRRFLSPFMPPSCRFTPTCSRYAVDAIRRYGAIRGGWLAGWRVLRCNPFTRGGYDPLV